MSRHLSAAADTADITVPLKPPISNALMAAAVLPPGEVTSSCKLSWSLTVARSRGGIYFKHSRVRACIDDHPPCPHHGLSSQVIACLPVQPLPHSLICHGLQYEVHVSGSTPTHASNSVCNSIKVLLPLCLIQELQLLSTTHQFEILSL